MTSNSDQINYSIISRGSMQIDFNGMQTIISGELTFTPIFYADLNSLSHWQKPALIKITTDEIRMIVDFITSDSSKEGKTKVVFD